MNFFVQHLLQNKDGSFNSYLPVIVKLNAPRFADFMRYYKIF